jgi:hypothetical protein
MHDCENDTQGPGDEAIHSIPMRYVIKNRRALCGIRDPRRDANPDGRDAVDDFGSMGQLESVPR